MQAQPETTQERGFGPFVTFVVRKRPDGVIARWESRAHRKHLHGAVSPGSTWWAPRDRDWWMGVLFAVGSFLFALGTVPAYADAVGARPDAVTFFIGSLFFTSAGFLQYREAVDAAPRRPGTARRKVFVFQPGRIDWLATAVQSVGTVEFNVSTFVAIWATVGSAQAQHHVWRPDILGSACFLVASALAWFEVCHGWAAWRPRSLAWWITGVNLPVRSRSGSPPWPATSSRGHRAAQRPGDQPRHLHRRGVLPGRRGAPAVRADRGATRRDGGSAAAVRPGRARPAVTGRVTSSGWSGPSRSCGAGSRRPA
jgi:hypothetical protein